MDTKPLDPSWVAWFKNTLDMMTPTGFMVWPLVGVAFQVNKDQKTLTALAEHPEFDRSGDTAQITERIVKLLGYNLIYLEHPARNLDEVHKALEGGNIFISNEVLAAMEQIKEMFNTKWPQRRQRGWRS